MNGKQYASVTGIVLICVFLTASIAAAGPVITVPVNRHDFGSVVEGAEVVHDFVIRNTGDAELVITRVKTG